MDWQILWTVFGGALGGALIGALATIFVTRMNHNNEHQKWLREEKLGAYLAALGIYRKFFSKQILGGTSNDTPASLLEDLRDAVNRVELLAPMHIVKKVGKVKKNVSLRFTPEELAEYKERVWAMRDAMREDIQQGKKLK